MPIEENKALVRRFFEETWNKGNPAAADDYIAASCVTKSGAPISPLVKRGITNWRRGFPDFAYQILRLVAEDDYVIAWTRFTGTHRGVFHHVLENRPWGPWEPTGKTIDVPEVYMFRLEAGKIAEFVAFVWGGVEFIEQLGVTLAPAGDQDMN
jgi:predicted ester cyclase